MTAHNSTSLKRTPLYEQHRAMGARLVEFGGWEMPVQYSSILEEHEAVRTRA
ncbi:MAG TPA: glycine cleavage system aminomethyltransferase GcvT, partial [Ktedonobacter sp.]|nr:glycine cleavage system aminomethyltransferase GcvT [Ktedonobacter sp.]